MYLVLGYLGLTLVLFAVWPINWAIFGAAAWARLIGYVLACFGVLAIGFIIGSRGQPRTLRLPVPQAIFGGAAVALLLLTPLSIVYTGEPPWEVLTALQDQGRAYLNLQYRASISAGGAAVALASALTAPITFAVLPLGILYWRRLSWLLRGCVAVSVLCVLILSIMRGTDREFANLIIVGSSSLLIAFGRLAAQGRGRELVARYWKAGVFAMAFIAIAATVFVERKEGRLGRTDRACAMGTGICADLRWPVTGWMGYRANFGMSMFVLSISQGYYGLALAMEKDFEPTWGVGHSPLAQSVYTTLSGDASLPERSFTARNSNDGWSDRFFWSTMMTWWANDVGFPGALVVVGLVGLLWGRSWRDAVLGYNDAAVMLFCILMIMLFYLPANNQVFMTLDGYALFGAWTLLTLFGSRPVIAGPHG